MCKDCKYCKDLKGNFAYCTKKHGLFNVNRTDNCAKKEVKKLKEK